MSEYGGQLRGVNAPQAKRESGGVAVLEQRITEIETEISAVYENLDVLRSRLYPPTPSPVGPIDNGAVAGSVENGLNRVLNRMQELRRLSNVLLHG